MAEQNYEVQGTASVENCPEGFEDRLEHIRTWVIRHSADNYEIVIAERDGEKSKTGKVLRVPSDAQEVNNLTTQWLGEKAASTIARELLKEGKAHLYTPRVRAEILAIHEDFDDHAEEGDVSEFMPSGRDFTPGLRGEALAAEKRRQTVTELTQALMAGKLSDESFQAAMKALGS